MLKKSCKNLTKVNKRKTMNVKISNMTIKS